MAFPFCSDSFTVVPIQALGTLAASYSPVADSNFAHNNYRGLDPSKLDLPPQPHVQS